MPFLSPVDTLLFAPDPARRAAARRELGLGEGDFVVGNVGNINPQKGHRTFIQAAAALRRVHPGARFVILGESYENHRQYEDELWAEGRSMGVTRDDNLVVRAPGSRVADLAAAFDVFWLSSVPRSEGIPNVIIEAMALGLPVVTTDVGGVRDIVQEGKTGFVVPPLAPERLARATLGLAEDVHLRLRLGSAARAFAAEHCSLAASADTHVMAFERALAHATRRRFLAST